MAFARNNENALPYESFSADSNSNHGNFYCTATPACTGLQAITHEYSGVIFLPVSSSLCYLPQLMKKFVNFVVSELANIQSLSLHMFQLTSERNPMK